MDMGQIGYLNTSDDQYSKFINICCRWVLNTVDGRNPALP